MIVAIVGVPGCGKTCLAVERAYEYMARGGCVFTNIRFSDTVENPASTALFDKWILKPDAYTRRACKMYNWEYRDGQYNYIDLETMDEDFLGAVPRGSPEMPILLILDEVNEWFDSLDGGKLKSDAKYRELFKFLRLSRHYNIDVVFVLQDFATLQTRLRQLCQYVYRPINLKNLHLPGLPVVLYGVPFFMVVQLTNKGAIVKKRLTSHKKWIFKSYDTKCEFGAVSIADVHFDSDFRKKPVAGKAGDIVEMKDRVFIMACCAGVAGFIVWRSPVAPVAPGLGYVTVTNTVQVVASPVLADGVRSAAAAETENRLTVEYAALSWGCAGSDEWAYADGRLYRVGFRVPNGLVVSVSKDFIRIVGDSGNEHFIYPMSLEGKFSSEPEKTKLVSYNQ